MNEWVYIIGGLVLAFLAGVIWCSLALGAKADEHLNQGEGWDD